MAGGAKYQPYPSYKSSGVEWLGDIPEGWETYSAKRLFDNRREPSSASDEQLAASQAYGVVPQSKMMERNNAKVMLALKGTESFRHVEVGDFVISLRSFEGGIEYSAFSGCVSPAYTVLNPHGPVSGQFFRHYLKSKPFVAALQASTDSLRDGKSISYQQFGALIVGLPPLTEQTKIAAFLDHETAKIDALIAKQQRLIALLEEKRQAVISHAVTKGLNPSAPLRPSGIDWLGDVPEHWEVKSLKHLGEVTDCKHITAEFTDDGFPLASIAEVKGWSVNLDTAKFTTKKYYESLIEGGRRPEINDIIYSRNATVGAAAIVTEGMPEFAMGQDVCLIRLSTNVLPALVLHILKSKVVEQQLALAMIGSTFKRINVEDIRNFRMAVPPKAEQKSILLTLEKISSKYADLIEKASLAASLLKERRTALISAAVTGKIDLRDWQPPASAIARTAYISKDEFA
ncbi:restriction endonuclease subunit S [Pseudophaeobacter sp. TrK17]|uniref:restriction endonuclease subunit S n=1 Tax=Pseudophaeobacter sp. TrK17 TaxID=2815167 RepID=UPI0035D05D96